MLVSILTISVSTSNVLATDHLEPAVSWVAGYEPAVAEVLRSAFSNDVHVRAIVEPSFRNEFAVGTKEENGKFQIFFVRASEHVWNALLDKKPTKDIPTTYCEYEIPTDLGHQLDLVWDGMLAEIEQNDAPQDGVDGDFYYFSKDIDGSLKIGMTWSPDEKSKPGKLVGIAYSMQNLCIKRDTALLQMLERQVDDLLTVLPNAHSSERR